MNQPRKQDAVYVVGDGERERLQDQATLLNPFTRYLFEDAGIGPGMRVLDVGSGMGDVALLAAEMVGPTGAVAGVDKNHDVLVAARQRAPDHTGSRPQVCMLASQTAPRLVWGCATNDTN